MPIPDYQTVMLPLLKLTADEQEHSMQNATADLAKQFKLSDSEISQLLPSARKRIFYDRVGWALTYLKKAGVLTAPRRGRFQITQRGLTLLKTRPEQITNKFLEQFEEFVDFRTRKPEADNGGDSHTDDQDTQTPQEAIEVAYQRLRQDLADEILQTIKSCTPAFFERLVIDLLVSMGYGGTRTDAGKAIGRSGDDGIDGIINEDRLGLDVIYIQAKKWENTVGRPEIQKFAGALQGQRAKKGIFITTSTFTKDAQDFAAKIDSKITLVDGASICQLMIDYGVGVNPVASFELKRLDSDYFSEE